MKVFLLIFFIFNVAFGEAFLRLTEQREEVSVVSNYAYAMVYSFRLSLGDTNTDGFEDNIQPVTLWFMFVLCALITCVIMLNLLVSVVGKSFDGVYINKQMASYKERSILIAENSFLLSNVKKLFTSKKKKEQIVSSYIVIGSIEDS